MRTSCHIETMIANKTLLIYVSACSGENISSQTSVVRRILTLFFVAWRLVLSCLVLSCLVLSCLVLSCLVLSCLVLSCLVLSCLVLSCLVLSCLVLSCLVLSCLVLSCLVLSCLVALLFSLDPITLTSVSILSDI